jgi:hypothetical protein
VIGDKKKQVGLGRLCYAAPKGYGVVSVQDPLGTGVLYVKYVPRYGFYTRYAAHASMVEVAPTAG